MSSLRGRIETGPRSLRDRPAPGCYAARPGCTWPGRPHQAYEGAPGAAPSSRGRAGRGAGRSRQVPARFWREAQITPGRPRRPGSPRDGGRRRPPAGRPRPRRGRAPPTAARRRGRRPAATTRGRRGDGRPERARGRLGVALAGEVVPHREGTLGISTPFVPHVPTLPGRSAISRRLSKGNNPGIYNGGMDGVPSDRDLAPTAVRGEMCSRYRVLRPLRVADAQRGLPAAGLPVGAAPGSRVVKVAEAGRGNGRVGHGAALYYRDAGAEHGVRLHVVRRTVNRVEEPRTPVLRDRTSSLFGEDGIVGVALRYGVHHQLLTKEVYLGYEIFRGLLPYLTRVLVA